MAGNVFRRRTPVEPGPRKGRMLIVSILMALMFFGLIARSWWLQVERNDHYIQRSAGQHKTTITLRASRGPIRDRNGRELALTAMVPSVYAVPRTVADAAAAAAQLAPIIKVDQAVLVRRLSNGRAFTWLARQVEPEVAARVEALAIEGVALRQEPRRFYPNRSLAGSLLGFAGIDGRGLEGIERDFDRYLQGREYTLEALRNAAGKRAMPGGALPPERLTGYGLTLTIDARIQQVAEEALINQVREMEAKSGVVVVMDPHSGDVLALAQTPAFDPNLFREAKAGDWRNRAITDTLEPGSTIKPILISAAIDMKKTRADSVWNGHKGRFRVGRKTITDTHASDELTTLEIIKFSSNVGATQVAQRIGKEAYYRYLRAFGFGEPTGLGLRGEQIGNLRSSKKWGQIHLATFSYGYGFSVTPLQMARAYSVIANGGHLVRPRIVREVVDARGKVIESFPPRRLRRTISARAAKAVTRGLVMVTDDGGTGKRARVPGYLVAGKTGTAYKVDPLVRGYNKNKIRTSFAGFLPADDPRLVIYVAIDEPQNDKRYGGVVAAPVFAAIGREALPYLGVEANQPFKASDTLVEDEDERFVGLEPQSRPWWFQEAVLTGAPSYLVAPDFTGRPLSDVVHKAGEMKLKLSVRGAGLVVSQRPQAGALLPPDAALSVVLERPGTRSSDAPEVVQ
jgi:cell division protein FtsI (penicillin-binding protein 3)